MKYDVIIIGAGASGLAAMRKLIEAGLTVCMIEASNAPGGRIATIQEGFKEPVEAGAEFVHGKLPLTFKLIKEAKLSFETVEGNMIGVQNGQWLKEEHDEHWAEFMRQLKRLKKDITVQQFLDDHFSDGEYIELSKAVQRFAEGFNLAEISKASMFALKNEWKDIEKKQYRIKDGYGQLIDHLYKNCNRNNSEFYFNTIVEKVSYKKHIRVYTVNKKKFEADHLISTVSIGVLQSGSIQFEPELKEHAIAIQGIGFGTVIKFLLEFRTNFWKDHDDNIGFILSDEQIPTWWTQLPTQNNLLTGWMGGPNATENIYKEEASLLQTALLSLSSIFKIAPAGLREQLVNYKIINWLNDPFIKGGYSYNTLHSQEAKKILAKPIDDKIYFAGEAVSKSDSQGTVESALQSGYDAADVLLTKYK